MNPQKWKPISATETPNIEKYIVMFTVTKMHYIYNVTTLLNAV